MFCFISKINVELWSVDNIFRLMYYKGITVVAGCPSKLYDEEDIDWAPTIKLSHQKVKPISDSALRRQKRSTERDTK